MAGQRDIDKLLNWGGVSPSADLPATGSVEVIRPDVSGPEVPFHGDTFGNSGGNPGSSPLPDGDTSDVVRLRSADPGVLVDKDAEPGYVEPQAAADDGPKIEIITDPNTPDAPKDSEDPDNPKDPDNPEDPKDPDDPKDPNDPEDPKDPNDPEDPDNPKDPDDPDNPKDPDNPEDPKDPEDPDN
ncbi:hypothetical protein AB0B56_19550, partial [Streptosporangium canum]|uniref:hypothetical protein n=1 Tax=Streptosporangium canum TaxID=324952 RepID=UPI00344903CA